MRQPFLQAHVLSVCPHIRPCPSFPPAPTPAPQAAAWDADGVAATSVLVASQLENEGEGQGYTRFVFPCMDEPRHKVRGGLQQSGPYEGRISDNGILCPAY